MQINKKQITTLAITIMVMVIVGVALYHTNRKNTKKPETTEILTPDENDIVFGNPEAPLAVYMYASYNCSYCRQFFTDVLPKLKEKYIDSKKIKIVLRLTSRTSDKRLKRALKAQICINKYGNYQYIHELLLNNFKVVYTNEFQNMISEFAEKDSFIGECIDGTEAASYLIKNVKEFESKKFTGTPTFVIGNMVYPGYRDADKFDELLDRHLKDKTIV